MLTIEHIVIPIKSIEDLAGSSKYKILFEAGTAYADYFESAIPGDVRFEIWSRIEPKSQLINTSKESNIIEKIMMENDDFVYFGSTVTFTKQAIPCHIVTDSETYLRASMAWPFQKNSPYLPLINFNLNKALETGTISQIMRRYINIPDESRCSVSNYKQFQIINKLIS